MSFDKSLRTKYDIIITTKFKLKSIIIDHYFVIIKKRDANGT